LSAIQRTAAKILDAMTKTIRTKSTTNNNRLSRISVYDETTRHSSDIDTEKKMDLIVPTEHTRGGSIGRACESICHEILAKSEGDFIPNKNIGNKATESSPNNKNGNNEQQNDGNKTTGINN
jgi:hypothetical protein